MSEIACHDLIRSKINNEIQKKRKILLESYQELKNNTEKNELYDTILGDYNKYYEYIKNDKDKQINQLKYIYEYLENLKTLSISLDEKNNKIKEDQREILDKIFRIKDELQEITS